jgi:hypothetical protein
LFYAAEAVIHNVDLVAFPDGIPAGTHGIIFRVVD